MEKKADPIPFSTLNLPGTVLRPPPEIWIGSRDQWIRLMVEINDKIERCRQRIW